MAFDAQVFARELTKALTQPPADGQQQAGPFRWLMAVHRDPVTQLIESVDLVPVERVAVPGDSQ